MSPEFDAAVTASLLAAAAVCFLWAWREWRLSREAFKQAEEARHALKRLSVDPGAQWFHAHFRELVERYAGQTVAIHEARGVVAHGTYSECVDELKRLDIADAEVVLTYIRRPLTKLSSPKPDN